MAPSRHDHRIDTLAGVNTSKLSPIRRDVRAMEQPPAGQHLCLHSPTTAETLRSVDRELSPRTLRFVGDCHHLRVRMHVVRRAAVSPMYLSFGTELLTGFDATSPYYFVVIALTGRLDISHPDGEFSCRVGSPAVVSPHAPVTLRWYPETSALLLRLDRAALHEQLADLLARPAGEHTTFRVAIDLSDPTTRGWVQVATTLAGELGRPAGIADSPLVARDMERVLLRGLLLCQPHTYSADLSADPLPDPLAAALAVVEDSDVAALTSGALARRVGVSVRALQSTFRDHLGLTPQQYLRRTRLRRAREDLLAHQNTGRTTVSAIANRWGFNHLGRFAIEYRSHYGESPSDTLRPGD
jgi:AraC-like DNA-binding protein